MKKVLIYVEERLTYNSDAIIEVPDNLSDDEFNDILDKTQKEVYDGQMGDILSVLKRKYGFKTIERSDSFPDSPSDSEIEITDYDYLKGGESD